MVARDGTRARHERAVHRGDQLLGGAALATSAGAAVLALVVAPTDMTQGTPQRLMYVHVPSAWVAYLGFAMVLVASIAYLARRDLHWDRRAQAAAEIGVALTALAIVTGSIWGRPVWGVWWTWEPRLVTTAVLLLVYIGYLSLRSLPGEADRRAVRAAALGIAGFVTVPIVHFSVVWWRTLHQPPTVLAPDGPAPIDPLMLSTLLIATAAFTLAGAWVWRRRVRLLARRTNPAQPRGSSVGTITVERSSG